jgi:3-oxoacyl-[acyl-carrier protein] reductase
LGRLDGKRAVITGASSGIGEAAARLFVSEGARVALVARRAQRLEAIASELAPAAVAVPGDVSDPEQAKAAVHRAVSKFDGLDVVVSCAGISRPLSLAFTDAGAWKETIDVNLSGTFFVAKESGLRMRAAGGGVIVNVGSELSFIGMPLFAAYCASKAGVLGLTRALAAELAPTVRVNAICPGPVDTPMLQQEFDLAADPEAERAAMVDRVPLRRIASSLEAAEAILDLALMPFATGVALQLDGGTTTI